MEYYVVIQKTVSPTGEEFTCWPFTSIEKAKLFMLNQKESCKRYHVKMRQYLDIWVMSDDMYDLILKKIATNDNVLCVQETIWGEIV